MFSSFDIVKNYFLLFPAKCLAPSELPCLSPSEATLSTFFFMKEFSFFKDEFSFLKMKFLFLIFYFLVLFCQIKTIYQSPKMNKS